MFNVEINKQLLIKKTFLNISNFKFYYDIIIPDDLANNIVLVQTSLKLVLLILNPDISFILCLCVIFYYKFKRSNISA